jgi:hypothetical protein
VTGGVERAAAGEAEHVIAKAVERAGVRDAEQVGARASEQAAGHGADRSVADAAEHTVVDPRAHLGPEVIDHARPGGNLIPEGYDRFGGLSEDEFLAKHWDPDTLNEWDGSRGNWRYPAREGFDGPSREVTDLPTGFRFDRFGGEGGEYVSPTGTPFEQRALPPDSLGKPYKNYELAKPFDAESGYPRVGKVARAFEQPGGGIQLKLPRSVQWLRENHYLREVQP